MFLTEEIRLEVFESPDFDGFPGIPLTGKKSETLLCDGDSVYSRENQFEILGTSKTLQNV